MAREDVAWPEVLGQKVVERRCSSLLAAFFLQAEDGIRAIGVTGVQTCALPIFVRAFIGRGPTKARTIHRGNIVLCVLRSEERREGKSVDLGGRRIIKKNNN